jgi:hypothetical protein
MNSSSATEYASEMRLLTEEEISAVSGGFAFLIPLLVVAAAAVLGSSCSSNCQANLNIGKQEVTGKQTTNQGGSGGSGGSDGAGGADGGSGHG